MSGAIKNKNQPYLQLLTIMKSSKPPPHLLLPIAATALLWLFLTACQQVDRSADTTSAQQPADPIPPEAVFAPTKSIPGWEMYIDSNSYAIQYPPAWKIKVGEGNDIEMLRIESPNGKNTLTLQVLATLSGKSLGAMCESLAATLEVEVLEQTADTLGGKPACRVHYAFRTNDNRQITKTLYLTNMGMGMMFYYFTLSGNAPDLERIVRSIQFK